MYNLDSLTLKYLFREYEAFLTGAVLQKIQMVSKREIILSLRNLGQNKKLYINLDPKFAHLNFVEDKNDYAFETASFSAPPMFCMLLRKHLEGAKIFKARLVEYERILELYFNVYDEIGSLTPVCLALEFMGKHSNAILYNASNGIITGCVHNISPQKSSVREVWGGIKYIYPPKQQKKDILKTTLAAFCSLDFDDISKEYYYLSGGIVDFAVSKTSSKTGCTQDDRAELFSFLQNLVSSGEAEIKEFWCQNLEKERVLLPPSKEPQSLNFLTEKYFSSFVMKDLASSKRNALQKLLSKEIEKYKKTISSSSKRNSHLSYKQKGELILANIWKISQGDKKAVFDGVEIALDPLKTPSENAQRYFNLYNKEKTALAVTQKRADEAKTALAYLEELAFCAGNSDNPFILDEIYDELLHYLNLQGKQQNGKNSKKQQKTEPESLEYQGFKIYIGKNNKQNDYLIKKISAPEDIWLHAKGCPSSHVFIKTQNGKTTVTDDVLLYAARLVKQNSPLRESAKADIIYTRRKFLKRPPDTHLGYVTYREEKEITI